jgi:hypothetical protein
MLRALIRWCFAGLAKGVLSAFGDQAAYAKAGANFPKLFQSLWGLKSSHTVIKCIWKILIFLAAEKENIRGLT